jgi:hypothetical protein
MRPARVPCGLRGGASRLDHDALLRRRPRPGDHASTDYGDLGALCRRSRREICCGQERPSAGRATRCDARPGQRPAKLFGRLSTFRISPGLGGLPSLVMDQLAELSRSQPGEQLDPRRFASGDDLHSHTAWPDGSAPSCGDHLEAVSCLALRAGGVLTGPPVQGRCRKTTIIDPARLLGLCFVRMPASDVPGRCRDSLRYPDHSGRAIGQLDRSIGNPNTSSPATALSEKRVVPSVPCRYNPTRGDVWQIGVVDCG